ncbi:MAG: CoA transferase [Ilumatobacteraceae bacterium]
MGLVGGGLGLSDGELPLAGVRVVEFAQMLAGPSAGLLLADYGAAVVKVEPVGGDRARSLRAQDQAELPASPLFLAYNRDKELIVADLKTEEGRAKAWALIEEADVVLESARPGAMDRLGFGAADVFARRPDVVYASVAGFGWGERRRARGGVDMIAQAESGFMSTTGFPENGATKVGFPVIDAATGHALCHGILAALVRKLRTGRGSWVRASLYDVAIHLQSVMVMGYLLTGSEPVLSGNSAPHTSPADVLQCRDGAIVVAAYMPHHFKTFTSLLGLPELALDPRFETQDLRVEHRDELISEIEAVLRTKNAAAWIDEFVAAGLLVAEVKDYPQLIADLDGDPESIVLTGDGQPVIAPPTRLIDAADVVGSAGGVGRVSE